MASMVCKLNVVPSRAHSTGIPSSRTGFCRAKILRPLCCNADASSSSENSPPRKPETKLLSSLDSYFSKLQNSSPEIQRTSEESAQHKSKELQALRSLNAYFDKISPSTSKVPAISEKVADTSAEDEKVFGFLKELEDSFDNNLRRSDSESEEKSIYTDGVPRYATTFTNIIIGMNVAVFLFGLASPIQTPEMIEVPLPLLYGAKINALIADGEWWRLITPMFLHDGLIHIGLGVWALVSFGPSVESVYGPAGFCMIYFLGGVFGNLTSFFHTPVPTVGGTGPLYALVAAWGVYILQNRQSFGKEMQAGLTGDVVQKLLVMGALHLALTDALPADNWTHIGATLVGTLFGLLATPKAPQMNLRLEEMDNKMVIAGEAPDLQKLTVAFALCLGVFFILYSFGNPAAYEILRAVSQTNHSNFL